jgi:hypothetical protein
MIGTLCTMFAKTSPWPLKIVMLGTVILSEYAWVHVERPNRHRPILYVICAYILSTMLPSLVFAMPDRDQTTTYVVQTVLMLLCMLCFLAFLGLHGLAQYEVVSIQLIVSHILWAQSVQLHTKAHILLYQGAIVLVNRLLLFAVVCLYGFVRTHKDVDHATLLVVLFVPEVLGLGVRVASLVMHELGGIFENFMLS